MRVAASSQLGADRQHTRLRLDWRFAVPGEIDIMLTSRELAGVTPAILLAPLLASCTASEPRVCLLSGNTTPFIAAKAAPRRPEGA